MSPRAPRAPERRAQIVDATVRCLARHGYTGLTMKRVAREAGVSQGILHYYFADKRAILAATLDAVTRDLDRRVAAAQARGPRDARARLRALVRTCLAVAAERREVWIVFIEFWGEMMHDRRLAAVNAAVYARTRRLIARLVADGIAAGRFRALDPERAAAVVLGVIDGLSLQMTFDAGALPAGPTARACTDALERFLAREDRP